MSKLVVPTMKERFYFFMKDLEIIKTFNGVKALSRKNFSLTSIVENDDAIRIFLGSGLVMEIKEYANDLFKRTNKQFVCILKDVHHNRIIYQEQTINEVTLWQAVTEKESLLPFVTTNLALSKVSVDIPDTTFSIQEVAMNALY